MTNKKPVKWFPLDVDALEDPKVMALVMALGMEGFGIYLMLIMYLAKEEPVYMLPIDCLKILAFKNHVSEEKIKAVVQGFSLFDIEGDMFYSRSLLRRMEIYDTIRQKNKEKAEKRWEKVRELYHSNATALPVQCQNSTEQSSIEQNNIIQKRTRQKKLSPPSFDYFVDEKFSSVWKKWIEYKTEIGDPYKTLIGATTQYKNLLNLCRWDAELAMKIIDQSIAHEWKGLFPLKDKPLSKSVPGETAIQKMMREMEEMEKLEEHGDK